MGNTKIDEVRNMEKKTVREANIKKMCECIKDAREVIKTEKLMDMQSHVLSIAICFFNKGQ